MLIGPEVASEITSHPAVETSLTVPLHDPAAVMDAVENYHARRPLDVLLPVYEGGTALTATLAKRLGLRGIPLAAALASRNKYLSYLIWSTAGVPVPQTIPLLTLNTDQGLIRDLVGYPAVLKLTDSMNSQGVIKAADDTELKDALARLGMLLNRSALFDASTDRNRFAYGRSDVKGIAQEFCLGSEVGVELLLCGEREYVLGIFEKAPAMGPYFAESMSIWPTSLGSAEEARIEQLAVEAVRTLGVEVGAAHVEIRYANDEPRVLEAGLRPGGAYTVMAIRHLTGFDIYGELLHALAGDPTGQPRSPRGAALYGGIVYPRSGVLTAVSGTNVFEGLPGLLDVQFLHRVGDQVYALPESAQPHFSYYLLSGADREDVLSKHQHIQETGRVIVE